MAKTLRLAFMCLVWALIMKLQIDYEQDRTASRLLKDSLELAVHDAAMMLNVERFSEREIVFDKELAEIVFQWSLEKNLDTDLIGTDAFTGTFMPNDNSFFNEGIQIIHVDVIDDNSSPNVEYPCVYGSANCGNAVFDLSGRYENLPYFVLNGPSIIVIAETSAPRLFNNNERIIRQAAVYSYKDT